MNGSHRCLQCCKLIRIRKLLSAPGKYRLFRCQVLHIIKEKPLSVDKIEMLLRFSCIHSLVNHFLIDSLYNAAASRSGPEAHISLISELPTRNVQRPENTRQRDNSSSFDIIIEYWIAVYIFVQQICRMSSPEILKVEVQMREHPLDKLHKRIHKGIILVIPGTAVMETKIQRIVQKTLTIRARINDDRQHLRRINPCRIGPSADPSACRTLP